MGIIYDYNDVLRYKRGQIWMVKEDADVARAKIDAGVRTICKTRPYLIVSSDEVAEHDEIIQGYPLTSKIDNPHGGIVIKVPAERPYTNKNQSLILINQLTAIESRNMMDYMCTVSDKTLERIDKITVSRNTSYDISQFEKEIKRLKHDYEAMCQKLMGTTDRDWDNTAKQNQEATKNTVDDCDSNVSNDNSSTAKENPDVIDVKNFLITYGKKISHKLLSKYRNTPNHKIKITAIELYEIFLAGMNNGDFSDDQIHECKEWLSERTGKSIETITTSGYKRIRRIWTKDMAREFVNDYHTMTKEECSVKWGYAPHRIRATATYCYKKINE